MYKFCHYLTKPIITRIIVSLMFKNVSIRIEVTVFRDFITLVKYVQILPLFNEAIITRIIVSLVLENVVVRARGGLAISGGPGDSAISGP